MMAENSQAESSKPRRFKIKIWFSAVHLSRAGVLDSPRGIPRRRRPFGGRCTCSCSRSSRRSAGFKWQAELENCLCL